MKIKKYRKTAIVEAIQFIDNDLELYYFTNGAMTYNPINKIHQIKTLEGIFRVNNEDYICKGINGEFWSIQKEIFENTYEEIDDGNM